jgi:hypothetical protein
MGALLPDCVRRHRGQHAHDPGQPLEAQDVWFSSQLLTFLTVLQILEAPNFFN